MDGKQRYDSAKPQAVLFIDGCVGGKNIWQAYRDAGYIGGRPAASDAAKRYAAAIDYQKKLLSKGSEDARARALEILTMFAEGSLGDILPKGLMTPEIWAKTPKEFQRLVSELQMEKKDDGVKFKVKIQDRLGAIALLARMQGWEKPIKLQDVTEPEVLEARAKLEEQIARRRAAKAEE